LALEACETFAGLRLRRLETSFDPGLGTSVGGIKPVFMEFSRLSVGETLRAYRAMIPPDK